jgi:hypothetical protein
MKGGYGFPHLPVVLDYLNLNLFCAFVDESHSLDSLWEFLQALERLCTSNAVTRETTDC